MNHWWIAAESLVSIDSVAPHNSLVGPVNIACLYLHPLGVWGVPLNKIKLYDTIHTVDQWSKVTAIGPLVGFDGHEPNLEFSNVGLERKKTRQTNKPECSHVT